MQVFRSRRSRFVLSGAALIVALPLVIATTNGASAAVTAPLVLNPNSVVRVGNSIPLACLDPGTSSSVLADPNGKLMFDYLIARNPGKNGSSVLSPDLATSWSFGANFLRLNLRKGVKFQDNTAFNAAAVVQNFTRDKTLGAYGAAKLISFVTDVVAVSPYVVRYDTTGPGLPELPAILSMTPGVILSPTSFSSNNECNDPIGAGPYKVQSYVAGSTLTLTRFNGYWNRKAQGAKQFIINYIGGDDTRLNALLTKQEDIVNVRPFQAATARKNKSLKTYAVTMPQFLGLFVTNNVSPLDNPLVRQAINVCLNRKGIVNATEGGLPTPATQPFLKGTLGYDPSISDYPYSVTQGKALLAQAGYPNGVTFTLGVYSALSEFVTNTNAIQGSLAQCGITVQIIDDAGNIFGDWLGGKFNAVYFGWSPVPDPSLEVNTLFMPTGLWNPGKQTPASLVSLENAAENSVGAAARSADYMAISNIVVNQSLDIPLYWDVSVMTMNKCVVGWKPGSIWTNINWSGVGMAKNCKP